MCCLLSESSDACVAPVACLTGGIPCPTAQGHRYEITQSYQENTPTLHTESYTSVRI